MAEGTAPWGVQVQRVEIKDIRLPYQLMRSMAAEAGAARDARSLIVLANGERQASWPVFHLPHFCSSFFNFLF